MILSLMVGHKRSRTPWKLSIIGMVFFQLHLVPVAEMIGEAW